MARIPRFRISSILLAVALIAVPLNWYAANHSQMRFENKLLSELKPELGPFRVSNGSCLCMLRFENGAKREPANFLNRLSSGICPDVFQRITQIDIYGIGCDGEILTDDNILNKLARFPHLKRLDLGIAGFTRAGIEKFRESRTDVIILSEPTLIAD